MGMLRGSRPRDDRTSGVFQMPSPRPHQYEGNPQGNSGINHDKLFKERGDPISGLSDKNDDSYNFMYNRRPQAHQKRVNPLTLTNQAFSPYKRENVGGKTGQLDSQMQNSLLNDKFELFS